MALLQGFFGFCRASVELYVVSIGSFRGLLGRAGAQ